MKITLINPPSPYLENDAAYPPMGLMYLAASIEKEGHRVTIQDLSGGCRLRLDQTDLVGITCVTPNVKIVVDIIEKIPQDIPIMVGGPHPTFLPQDMSKKARYNAIVLGEGEDVVKEVMRDISEGRLGPKWYNGGLVPVHEIPIPARHLVDLNKYSPGGEKATPVYTSRGCSFSCNFCSKMTGNTLRLLPVEHVVADVENAISFGLKKIVFGDDNIALNSSRLHKLMSAIEPLDIEYRLNMDTRHLDRSILEQAAATGCTDVSYGIESGSQSMLDVMNKKTTVEMNRKVVDETHRCGLRVKAYLMVNFPGETEETVRETLRFIENTPVDQWLVSSFAPLPGSDTFSHPEKYGIIWMSDDWADYYLVGRGGCFSPCFETKYLTGEKQVELHNLLMDGLKNLK